MNVTVFLHTTLQRLAGAPPGGRLQLALADSATLGDVLRRLEIPLPPDALILVVNHRIAGTETVLRDGDRVDIIPAISGGCAILRSARSAVG